jgi:hypothetical protein
MTPQDYILGLGRSALDSSWYTILTRSGAALVIFLLAFVLYAWPYRAYMLSYKNLPGEPARGPY